MANQMPIGILIKYNKINMNKKGNFLFLICLFFVFVSCNNEKKQINSEETSNQQMYENSIFSLLIPDGYIYDESLEENGVNKLCIYRDSLEDFRTTIDDSAVSVPRVAV